MVNATKFHVHRAEQLIWGDCFEVMAAMPDGCVDAIVTDPPYGLKFMGKHWDCSVPSVVIWEQALRVLRPGGHLLSFFSTRTYHRGVVNIEDAGFEIRDQIAWLYGSGFPKSHNLKDDMAGWGTALKPAHEPIVVARKPLAGTVAANVLEHGTGAMNIDGCRVKTDEVARLGSPSWGGPMKRLSVVPGQDGRLVPRMPPNNKGRWPANLIHDGSEEVVRLFPTTQPSKGNYVRKTGSEQFLGVMGDGKTNAPDGLGDAGSAARFFYCAKSSRSERNKGLDCTRTVQYAIDRSTIGDLSCKDVSTVLVGSLRRATSESTVTWYIGESGESIMGLCPSDSLSTTLTAINRITTSQILSLLPPLLINAFTQGANLEMVNGGNRAGNAASSSRSRRTTTSGSPEVSAPGARLVVSEMLSTISDAANWKPLTNIHATVKPLALMRYLCRLVTPPGGIVLDCFCGSGSTLIAAKEEHFGFIGIEQDERYCKIARGRLVYTETT